MPFTVRPDGWLGRTWGYPRVMVTGEPGLTVPLGSLTLIPGGAETLNETGPLTALRVNEPVKNPNPDRNIGTVPGDALRAGRGGAGFGFGGGVRGGADRAGDAVGWLRAGADGGAGGADEPGDTPPGGAEIGRAGPGAGAPGGAESPGAAGTENGALAPAESAAVRPAALPCSTNAATPPPTRIISAAGQREPAQQRPARAAPPDGIRPGRAVTPAGPPRSSRPASRGDLDGEPRGVERPAPADHLIAVADGLGTVVGNQPQHLLPQALGHQGQGHEPQQHRRAEDLPAALAAGLAAIDMPPGAGAPHHRRTAIPAVQQRVQAGAGAPARAGHEQGPEGPVQLVAGRRGQRAGLALGHAEHPGQVSVVQAVPPAELGDLTLVGA